MTLLAFDGNSILNRAFYGIRPLTTKEGINTNAVYGFLNILLRHLQDLPEAKIAVAFDRRKKTFRHNLYTGYKATRKQMPEELAQQLPIIKEILHAMNIVCIEKAGLEADDIIGTLSRQAEKNGDTCVIITGDRDSFQLINDTVSVKLAVTSQKGSPSDDFYDKEKIFEKYGLSPQSLIDLKGLMGDTSDNIPGVPGIGEKTALALLHEFGTLDNIFENLDKIKETVRAKLENGKESAYMSRELGKIVTDAELPVLYNEISSPRPNEEELSSLFGKYELASMYKRFNLEKNTGEKKLQSVTFEESKDENVFCQDVFYMIYAGGFFYIKKENTTIKTVADITKIGSTPIVTHDAKPLIKLFSEKGAKANIIYDTLLAAYILDPSKTSYTLSSLAEKYCGICSESEEYLACTLDIIKKRTLEEIENNGQHFLYYNIELPLCSVLADMELAGFEADAEFLKKFGEITAERIKSLTDSIYFFAGKEFNINSTKQLGEILFNEMHMPVIRKTKTGFSTDNEVLEKLLYKTDSPLIENIIEYRKLTKLKSTYVDGLLKTINKDGRIHTVFTQTVTQTGRISSIEPNLQHMPVRTELGRNLRKVFRAKEGYTLLDADYSQIELRVLAHIANDPMMQQAFIENKDIHTITASQVFGIPPEMISGEMRRRAKAVNFGIVYGIGEYSLSQDIHVSVKEAKQYIENYMKTYSGVRDYMQQIINKAKEQGYVETMFARRRYVQDVNAKNGRIRAFAERVCRNTPIQGTAADLIKLAMVHVYKRLQEERLDARIILQVHDELILEVSQHDKERAKEILKYEMENAHHLSVPLIAEIGEGETWYDAH